MKVQELAALGDEQLVHKELELERAMMGQTFRHRLNQLENTSTLKKTRRDVARAQTVLTQREHTAKLDKGTLRARHASTFSAGTAAAGAQPGAGEDFLKGILDSRESAE